VSQARASFNSSWLMLCPIPSQVLAVRSAPAPRSVYHPASAFPKPSGLHAATWGMYKDLPYEGFSSRKYLRSPLIGGVAGVVLQAFLKFDLGSPAGLLMLFGSVGGWVSALGGAWKDAPLEGFQLLKFFRSPTIAAVYGLAMAAFTTSWVVIAFGALGLTVATIESRKTFATSDAPGKFRGRPVPFPEAVLFRRRFVPVFAAIWLLVLTTMFTALAVAPAASGPRKARSEMERACQSPPGRGLPLMQRLGWGA